MWAPQRFHVGGFVSRHRTSLADPGTLRTLLRAQCGVILNEGFYLLVDGETFANSDGGHCFSCVV